MLFRIISLLIILQTNSLFAQDHQCGQSEYDQHQISYDDLYSKRKMKDSFIKKGTVASTRSSNYEIPLALHIMTLNNTENGISECDVIESIETLQTQFASSPFTISISSIEYHADDTKHIITSYTEADEMHDTYSQSGALNVYFVHYSLGSCGFANFPWDADEYMVLKNSCAINGSTFAHEVGHYLGLYHTHETSLGYEYVERSGCETTGDLLCDTEADPNLSNKVYSNCAYNGNEYDNNNDAYIPMTDNLMSYSRKTCRNNFTEEQNDRMVYYYETVREAQFTNAAIASELACPCIDEDNDGLCLYQDPNDNDSCNPNADPNLCSDCTILIDSNFDDNDLGIWNDGGSDCYLIKSPARSASGEYSVRIRDNSNSASSIYTDVLDLSAYASISVSFNYYAKSMEAGEDFLFEISYDEGSTFDTLGHWVVNTDFTNNNFHSASIEVDGSDFNDEVVLRFRCDASANYDMIYIDDILVESCPSEQNNQNSNFISESDSITDEFEIAESMDSDKLVNHSIQEEIQFNIFPNPIMNEININGISDLEDCKYTLYNNTGMVVSEGEISNSLNTINSSHLSDGLYIMIISKDSKIIQRNKIIKLQ